MFLSNFFYRAISILVNLDVFAVRLGVSDFNVTLYLSVIISTFFLIWLTVFILKGVGIYTLSKNNGVDKGWLGFIPFFSLYQFGRLIGPMSLFRVRFKNVGIHLAAFGFFVFVFSSALDFVKYFDTLQTIINANSVIPVINANGELISNTSLVINVLDVVSLIFQLIYEIILLFVMIAFFRLYSPRISILAPVLCIFVEPLFGIFVFAVRKRKKGSFYFFNPYAAAGGYGNGNPYERGEDPSKESPYNEYKNDATSNQSVFEEYPDRNNTNSNGNFNSGFNSGKNVDEDDMF